MLNMLSVGLQIHFCLQSVICGLCLFNIFLTFHGVISEEINQTAVVNVLTERKILQDERVRKIMLQVDRQYYTKKRPYQDKPQDIGYGSKISSPSMHAIVLQELSLIVQNGSKVLDVGSGSGYLTACLGLMAGDAGRVIGIEHIYSLVFLSRRNVMKDNPQLMESGIVDFFPGDGRLGYPQEAPYDVIHVGAMVTSVPPALLEQLKPGGKIMACLGRPDAISCRIHTYIKRANGRHEVQRLSEAMYLPMVDWLEQMAEVTS